MTPKAAVHRVILELYECCQGMTAKDYEDTLTCIMGEVDVRLKTLRNSPLFDFDRPEHNPVQELFEKYNDPRR